MQKTKNNAEGLHIFLIKEKNKSTVLPLAFKNEEVGLISFIELE